MSTSDNTVAVSVPEPLRIALVNACLSSRVLNVAGVGARVKLGRPLCQALLHEWVRHLPLSEVIDTLRLAQEAPGVWPSLSIYTDEFRHLRDTVSDRLVAAVAVLNHHNTPLRPHNDADHAANFHDHYYDK